jgi:hypothetical protein
MANLTAARLWEDRWRIGAWILPAALLAVFANQALLPLAKRLGSVRAQVAGLRENRYEPAWLDSTRASLAKDVDALAAFKSARESALNRDSSVQATVDRIRGLAQTSGIEVVKTTPILGRADSLRVLKVRIEGFSRYPSVMDFFAKLKRHHEDIFPEEMVIRQGGDRSNGRLEATLVLMVFDRRQGMGP